MSLSKRIVLPFLGVVLLLVAELVWWLIFTLKQAQLRASERIQTLTLQHHIISPEILTKIEHEHMQVVRMFVAEGLVFLFMLGAGSFLVFRAMRREVDLAKQQANFLSAVTHELKSPLASIRLLAETMQLRELTPEKRNHYLKAVEQETIRFEGLVNNILKTAKIEDKKFILRPIKIDLKAEITDIVKQLSPMIEAHHAQLNMQLEDQVFVFADVEALHTMLRNLLENAVKYGIAPSQPEILVRVYSQKNEGCVDVVDFGLGITPFEQKRIFDKFYRVGDELRRHHAGSGLGLFLVRSLAEQSKGKVIVKSAGKHQGSTFTLKLPKAVP